MTAKEFAEKHLNKKVRHTHRLTTDAGEYQYIGIVSGYAAWSGRTYIVTEEIVGAKLMTDFDTRLLATNHNRDFYLLRDVQHYYYWELSDIELIDDAPKIDLSRFPHICKCGSPAYIGAYDAECSKTDCKVWMR